MNDAQPATAAASGSATCPKCGQARRGEEPACVRCGLTFALWTPEQAAAAPRLDERAEALWAELDVAWTDQAKHDVFLKHCSAAGLLAPAGRRYRERLAGRPGDPLATRMQERIVAMATASFTRASTPPAPVTRHGWFWALLLLCGAGGMAAALMLGAR